MPNSITLRGLKLFRKKEATNYFFSFPEVVFHQYLLLQQMIRQNASRQHTEQMEELRDRHQNISRTHQIILRNHRMELSLMLKLLAGNNIGLDGLGLLPHPWFILLMGIVKVVMSMFLSIFVDVAEIYGKFLILHLLLLWM